MARVLAISSQVARGHVGLSAIAPALQRLGHEVMALPTIVLSNHPGHARFAGAPVGAAEIEGMIDALDANGWLSEVGAVLTGYLPSPAHVELAARAVRRLKAMQKVAYLCDPVLGDDPKGIYIGPAAAAAIRDQLVPLADALTPNRFELGWLAGMPVSSLAEVKAVTGALSCATVLVTSAAYRGADLLNLLSLSGQCFICAVPWRTTAPHGTGDLFAALFLGHVLDNHNEVEAMARAAHGVAVAIAASAAGDELSLVPVLDRVATASAMPVERL